MAAPKHCHKRPHATGLHHCYSENDLQALLVREQLTVQQAKALDLDEILRRIATRTLSEGWRMHR